MKRTLWLVVLIGVVSLFFASCNKKNGTDTAGDFNLRETGDVVLTFMMWGEPEEKQAVYKVLKSFQEKYPNIGIKVIHTDSLSYSDKLQAMFAGGTPPDVFYLHCENFIDYASKGLLYPLDDFASDPAFDLNDFYPELVNVFRFGGSLYGIPKDWTSFVLYYNKNLFDEAGIDYPSSDWKWNDLLTAAKALTKDKNGDSIIDQYGFIIETWASWYYSWIKQNGGEIFDRSGNWVFANATYLNKNAEALQFVADLLNMHKVAPDIAAARQLGSYESFMAGRVAMCMYGRWAMLKFKDIKNFVWDYEVLPHETQRASTVVTVSFSIAKDTMHPEEAWKLLEFLTSYEGQIFTAESGLAVPTRRSLVESDHYLKAPEVIKFQPQLAMNSASEDPFLQQLPYASFPPMNARWLEVRQKLDEQLEDVFLGNKDAKTVILSLDNIVSKILTGSDTMSVVEGTEE